MLICARVFVLKCLLDLLPADTSAETVRRRWVLAQVMPPILFDKDLFVLVLNSLRAAYKTDLAAFTDSILDELATLHEKFSTQESFSLWSTRPKWPPRIFLFPHLSVRETPCFTSVLQLSLELQLLQRSHTRRDRSLNENGGHSVGHCKMKH